MLEMNLRSVDNAGIEMKVALASVLVAMLGTSPLAAGEIADAIKHARITGGIVAVVNGSDATYDDAASSNCTVHGLESDGGRVGDLRRRLQAEGRYGRVSRYRGSRYHDRRSRLTQGRGSSRLMGFAVFAQEPSSIQVRSFLGRVIRTAGRAPKHLLSDKGGQFWCDGFKAWCRRRDIRPRFGAVGKHGSIAVVERLILTMKQILRKYRRHTFTRISPDQRTCPSFLPGKGSFEPFTNCGGCLVGGGLKLGKTFFHVVKFPACREFFDVFGKLCQGLGADDAGRTLQCVCGALDGFRFGSDEARSQVINQLGALVEKHRREFSQQHHVTQHVALCRLEVNDIVLCGCRLISLGRCFDGPVEIPSARLGDGFEEFFGVDWL